MFSQNKVNFQNRSLFLTTKSVCDDTIQLKPMHIPELFLLQHVLQYNLSAQGGLSHQAYQKNLLNIGKGF